MVTVLKQGLFCYVNDLIEGLFLLMNSSYFLPINLGNPKEYSIFENSKLYSFKNK